jgi:hypothetical protein
VLTLNVYGFFSSPTLSHSFFSLVSSQVVHLKLEEMVFFWFIIPFSVLKFLARNRHQREDEDSGHSHDNPEYEDGEGFEEDEEAEEGNEGGKASSTPLWKFVTKVEEGKGAEIVELFCPHDCHNGKPFVGSYTRVRHPCGLMDSDDKKGAIGITVCPKMSKEERQKYIKIEEFAQKKHGKKQKLHSDASSKFGGNTSTSPHGFGTYGCRRIIADFLDIGGRDEVDSKVVQFLYACGIPFNVLRSPYWHDHQQSPQRIQEPLL